MIDDQELMTGKPVAPAAVLHSKVVAELGAKYSEASPETRAAAVREILGAGGALLDASGNVVYTEAALAIAPRLAAPASVCGSDDSAKVRRADAITKRLASLPPVVNIDAREAIRALPRLRENASDTERISRANEILMIMRNSAYREESPDGD